MREIVKQTSKLQNNSNNLQRMFSDSNRIELEISNRKGLWKKISKHLETEQHIFKSIDRYKLPEVPQGKTT